MGKVFDTDVGTAIVLDTGINLTDATKVAIKARKPSGTVVELLAAKTETTKVRHLKTVTTLTPAGSWDLQAYVEFQNGATSYSGEIYTLVIYTSLKLPAP